MKLITETQLYNEYGYLMSPEHEKDTELLLDILFNNNVYVAKIRSQRNQENTYLECNDFYQLSLVKEFLGVWKRYYIYAIKKLEPWSQYAAFASTVKDFAFKIFQMKASTDAIAGMFIVKFQDNAVMECKRYISYSTHPSKKMSAVLKVLEENF